MNDKNIRFYYKHINGGVVTAACIRNELTANRRVGLSFCSPKDNFSKEKGRLIALGRAEKCPITVGNVNSTLMMKSVINDLTAYKAVKYIPKWAVG